MLVKELHPDVDRYLAEVISEAEEKLEDAEDKAYEEEYEDGKNFAGDDD